MTKRPCAVTAVLPAADPDPRTGAAAVLSALAVADGRKPATVDDFAAADFEAIATDEDRRAIKDTFQSHGMALDLAMLTMTKARRDLPALVRSLDAVSGDMSMRLVDHMSAAGAWFTKTAEMMKQGEARLMCGMSQVYGDDLQAPALDLASDRARDDDATLMALGTRWEHVQAEWQALWAAAPPDDDADDDDVGARSSALFDEIMATPAQTIAGLAVKARLLAVAHDVHDFSLPGVVAKATAEYEAGCRYHDQRAAFGLAADILRLAAA